ncbi:CoA transferase [Aureimonas ureilytica]|uniref:CoA transferase n=1 Tax=Aureimonas ureilytica TaxID=401562 RepID=UPI0009DBFCE4
MVELARILAGPWIGRALLDLGAEVVEVEAPGGGHTCRTGRPFGERDLADGPHDHTAADFHASDRASGRSPAISEDAEIAGLLGLIQDADAPIENFRVGGSGGSGSIASPCPGSIRASPPAPSRGSGRAIRSRICELRLSHSGPMRDHGLRRRASGRAAGDMRRPDRHPDRAPWRDPHPSAWRRNDRTDSPDLEIK